ncbi:transglycosylase family protein [Streptomyces sp. NBC_00233]|uniref:transglycosylase family protein n=1 Tax=Streptomyces sp. NBC_00233 TaxID=2975686 RepID=UPI0022545C1A|nr:transglycosylase family protein [Streptomyces sp. NBC_00233]MCX5233220.1 transglycosylase family protein [Streptomyces sp. NBC_00233]
MFFTGSGSHRRRTHHEKTIARVGVASLGAALPFLAAASATAAPESVWDAVAQCESSGDWAINTGNGFYGGLQFTASTWAAYGGQEYAPQAHMATKDQQIAIAEKVLAGQGPGAWPQCSVTAGLTAGDAPAQAAAEPTLPATPAARQENAPAKATVVRQRPLTPGTATAYRVAIGDTLSRIAETQHVKGGWQPLYQHNRHAIGPNPDLIYPGQQLTLPSPRTAEPPSSAVPAAAKPVTAPDSQQTGRPAPSTATGYLAPVSAPVTTGYRVAGSNWSSGYHTGVDFAVPTGTGVKAVTSGTVVSAGWAGAYGNQVIIRLTDGKYAQYAHLSSISVAPSQAVTSGQQIGLSGATGNTTGPHLHFEIRETPSYGSDISPQTYLAAHGIQI